MPVFSQTLSNQNTATSGGVSYVPSASYFRQFSTLGDQFNRTTVNPSNILPLYLLGTTNSGTMSIGNGNYLAVQTGATSNNYSDVLASEMFITRSSLFVDPRTLMNMDIIFNIGSATAFKFFIGLANISNITALPTTTNSLGVYYDSTSGSDFILTSGNGSAQVTTDTGKAADTAYYRLNILWTGNESGVISLYSSTNSFGTLLSSQTVTSLGVPPDNALGLHFLAITATASAKVLNVYEWRAQAT